MTVQKYSIEEALDRILRMWKGETLSDDSPFSLDGVKLTWNEALSQLAELFQGSLPGETALLPPDISVGTGSYSVSHDALHANGIGAQKLGNSISHVEISADGNVRLVQDATSWTDYSVGATRIRQGATAKPDFDTDEIGLLFPQDDPTEIAYLIIQFPHEKELNSEISPHLHYIQTATGTPIFEYYYRWYNNAGHQPNVWFTGSTVDGSRALLPYTSGSMLQIGEFPEVTPPMEVETVSSNFEMKIWRNDNIVSGDVLVKFIDIHYKKDGFGSNTEYDKSV